MSAVETLTGAKDGIVMTERNEMHHHPDPTHVVEGDPTLAEEEKVPRHCAMATGIEVETEGETMIEVEAREAGMPIGVEMIRAEIETEIEMMEGIETGTEMGTDVGAILETLIGVITETRGRTIDNRRNPRRHPLNLNCTEFIAAKLATFLISDVSLSWITSIGRKVWFI